MRLRCAFLVSFIACGGQGELDSGPAAAMPTTRGGPRLGADVYAALLDAVHTGSVPDTLLVADSTLSFQIPTGAEPSWQAEFDSLPKGLAESLQAISRDKEPSTTLPLPPPVQLITDQTRHRR